MKIIFRCLIAVLLTCGYVSAFAQTNFSALQGKVFTANGVSVDDGFAWPCACAKNPEIRKRANTKQQILFILWGMNGRNINGEN